MGLIVEDCFNGNFWFATRNHWKMEEKEIGKTLVPETRLEPVQPVRVEGFSILVGGIAELLDRKGNPPTLPA